MQVGVASRRRAGTRHWALVFIVIALIAAGGAFMWLGEPGEAPTHSDAAESRRSPRATVEALLEARGASSYQRMEPLILPGRAHEVVKTLMAVDEFLHADRMLCEYVRDHLTPGLSGSIDSSSWAAHLGVFSRYVELIDERIDGTSATVSFTIDGRVPVQRARLELVNGSWRYDPGPGYDPQLPAAFQRMSRGLNRVLDDLNSGRLAADEIRDRPELLIEELRVRLMPGIKMLPPPPSRSSGD